MTANGSGGRSTPRILSLVTDADRQLRDPAVNPTLRFAPGVHAMWRAPGQLQIELGERAVVVDGLDHPTVSALRRGEPLPDLLAGDIAADGLRTDVLDELRRAGLVTDRAPDRPTGTAAALQASDRSALSARLGDDRGSLVLSARAARRVAVHGGGRLPALIGSLLAAAGVGHLHVGESGEVTLRDVIPGGLLVGNEGARRASAVSAAIHRAAPGTDTSSFAPHPADLVIITTGTPVPRGLSAGFAHGSQPHLLADVRGSRAVVGPLVIPGRTSCLRCADLHRRDRDPAWPALAAQLALEDLSAVATEVGVASLAASITTVQALQYLDGERPATVDGTLEFALPDWRLRRRTWPIHPDCSCTVSLAG